MAKLREDKYLASYHDNGMILADLSTSAAARAFDFIHTRNRKRNFHLVLKIWAQEEMCVWRFDIAVKKRRRKIRDRQREAGSNGRLTGAAFSARHCQDHRQ
jgi:hypothetical protein